MKLIKTIIRSWLSFMLPAASVLAQCPTANPSAQVKEQSSWQLQWQLTDSELWLAPLNRPYSQELNQYWNYIESQTLTDPWYLLDRQSQIFYNAFGPGHQIVLTFDTILAGQAGRIEPINCLSALLMDQQLKFHPLNEPPGEFSAYIFQKDDQLLVFAAFHQVANINAPRVIFSQNNRQNIAAEAWELLSFLHNHPFSFRNPYGDIAGTVIPSQPDLSTFESMFRSQGLQEAWITNGKDTAYYTQEDVKRLLQPN